MMIASWMMYTLGIALLMAVAAVSAEWVLKSANRPVRFVWFGAIAMTLIFTALAPFRAEKAQAPIAIPQLALSASTTIVEVQPTLLDRVVASGQAVVAMLMTPVDKVFSVIESAPNSLNVGVAAFWLLSAIAAVLVFLTVYARSMRESLRWPRMNVLGRTVRVAPDVGPAVMGMAPPEIVIPRWVLLRNAEEQRLVLEHESEHVRAHDPLLLVFACIAVALMPWNPAMWFMWSRLRLAVELDCDRRVLRRGVGKPAYGELLVELSSQRPWNSLAMPAFSWGASHLEKRLVAMTARPVRFGFARRVASGSIVAVALLAACQSEMPTGGEIAAMDVAAVTERIPTIKSDSTVYVVEGRYITKLDAKALEAEDIAAIEVRRDGSEKGVSEVRIKLATDSMKAARKKGAGDMPLTVTGDSIQAFQIRPDRNLDKVVPEKLAAIQVAGSRITSGEPVKIVTDSTVLFVNEPKLKMDECISPSTTTPLGSDGSRIRIRGQASNNPCQGAPLMVIDGVIVENGATAFNQLNPNDISTVEIIKGPTAMQLYGSRAINGVIKIQMRK